jgi:hypothetical protein
VTGIVVAAALVARPEPIRAQEGTTTSRLAGAALGLYSGSLVGLAAGALPCSQVAATRTCSRIALASGGVIGGITGGMLGDADSKAIEDAYRDAGYGALAGAAVGIVVKQLVYYYDWADALAFTALGAAIGPVAPQAALGLAVGAASGFGLRLVVPSFELTDVAALGGIGLAVAGLTAWALKAGDAREGPGVEVPSVTIDLLTLRF